MKREWIVTKEDHQSRIDDFAFKHQISKKSLKAIKLKGDILVDGIHKTVRYQLNCGEVVTFVFPPEENNILPQHVPFQIVYEDEYLMVINKPPKVACIPTKAHPELTLANGISYYYKSIHLESTVHLVNRLDRETSGLMIVAKYRYIHDLMSQKGHIYRIYHAHVKGKAESGIIDLPIYRPGYEMKRVIDEKGKESKTYYRCLDYHDDISLVECKLATGRTHQIRVHMSAIGHPLVGDPLYGDGIGVFDLDSVKVCFEHPITKQIIYIEKKKGMS